MTQNEEDVAGNKSGKLNQMKPIEMRLVEERKQEAEESKGNGPHNRASPSNKSKSQSKLKSEPQNSLPSLVMQMNSAKLLEPRKRAASAEVSIDDSTNQI